MGCFYLETAKNKYESHYQIKESNIIFTKMFFTKTVLFQAE